MEMFSYKIEAEKVRITEYRGWEQSVEVPSVLDGHPVCIIGKKAFWGKKNLQSVRLPDTIKKIEEWAFAGCRELQEIQLPRKELILERRIFRNCNQLAYIFFGNTEQPLARLLACAATKLEADYLLEPLQAGSEKWYQSLDAKLLQSLEESEEAALRNLVYCAEEDMLAKQETCLYQQNYEKAQLAFLRLIYPQHLATTVFEKLKSYILQRNKGCKSEEAWDVVLAETKEQQLYCDKLFEIGGIHSENIDSILQSLGDNQIELKAYLLKKWQEKKEMETIWKFLSLDEAGPEELI